MSIQCILNHKASKFLQRLFESTQSTNNNLPLYKPQPQAFNNGEKTDLSGSLIIAMNIVSFKRELSSSLVPLILQFSLKHFIYYVPYKTVSKVAPFFALHILSVK